MMNFKPELLAKVLAGEKTQTRRPQKPNHHPNIVRDTLEFMRVGERYGDIRAVRTDKDRAVYEVGKDYAACPGRGKKQLGRIEIVRIRCEDVRSISDEDVRAEGFTSKYEFFHVWCGFYDPKALLNPNSIGKQIVMDTAADYPAEDTAKYLADWERITLAGRNVALYMAWVLDFKLVKG